jgi:hypothetical protein
LERLNISVLSVFLQRIIDDSNFQLIEFTNQVKIGRDKTIPDARIKSSFDYLIETKIVADENIDNQLKGHLEHLHGNSKLILLTPHNMRPEAVDNLGENAQNVIWINFDRIIDIIDSIVADKGIILNEKEIFLLTELKDFIIKENLLSDPFDKRVLVIPARTAFPFYLDHNVYVCQADRTFTLSAYIAFYYDSAIQLPVPRILAYCDNLNLNSFDINDILWHKIGSPKINDKENKILFKYFFDRNEVIERIKIFKKDLLDNPNLISTERNKILILSSPYDERNSNIKTLIHNNLVSPNDVTAAYVQNQRYTNIDKLHSATFTSDLI